MSMQVRQNVHKKLYVDFPLESAEIKMDRGRLIFVMDEKRISTDILKRIGSALGEVGIFSVVAKSDSNLWLDIPLKDTKNPEELVRCTVSVLKDKSYIDPQIGKEVLELWKFLPQTLYWSGTTEGQSPPPSVSHHEVKKYLAKSVRFQSVSSPIQNVIFKGLYEEKLAFGVMPGKFHAALTQLAQTKDFLGTSANLQLCQEGFKRENLIPAGPDGLNPIDLTLRSRNAALARALIGNITYIITDQLLVRALLNAILREIENSSQSHQLTENPWAEFSVALKENQLTKTLSKEQENKLDLYIGKLANAAIDVYAFLLGVFSTQEGTFIAPNAPIWLEFDGGAQPFNNFEQRVQLRETIAAFIMDRSLQFIVKADPSMTKEVEARIPEIFKAVPLDSIAKKALSIVTDPSSALSKMIDYLQSAVHLHPEIEKINLLLGEEFTAKYGLKWRLKGDSKKSEIWLEGFNKSDRNSYEAKLAQKGFKHFKFVPVTENTYRLVISVSMCSDGIPSKSASANSTNSLNDKAEHVLDAKKEINLAPTAKGFTPDQKTRLLEGYLEKARSFFEEGKRAEATKCLDRFDGLNPNDSTLLSQALELRRQIDQSASTSTTATMMIGDK